MTVIPDSISPEDLVGFADQAALREEAEVESTEYDPADCSAEYMEERASEVERSP